MIILILIFSFKVCILLNNIYGLLMIENYFLFFNLLDLFKKILIQILTPFSPPIPSTRPPTPPTSNPKRG